MLATLRRTAERSTQTPARRTRKVPRAASVSPFPSPAAAGPSYFSPSFSPNPPPTTSASASSSSLPASNWARDWSASSTTFAAFRHTPPDLLFPPPRAPRPLRVLGLESSADDACAAVVTSHRQVLSSVVMKQHRENARWGGIHPMVAHEAHLRDMPGAIQAALAQAKLTLADIDAVAYTRGPGMFGCLAVCATAARSLAAATGKPLVGVHHMQAHALTPLLTEETPPEYPFLTLLVSGGHTQLVLAESSEKFRILMTTMDNAIGGVFDKIARLLQLPHSPDRGLGPVLEEYAAAEALPPYDKTPMQPLPRPLSRGPEKATLSFSYAGLLTATDRAAQRECPNLKGEVPLAVQREVARVFQVAAVRHTVDKIRQCIDANKLEIKGLVVSGGVGSNQYLRQELGKMLAGTPVTLHYPPISLCTDNAAMIAWVAILRLQAGLKGEPFDLPIRKKWSLEDLYDDVPPQCYH